MTATSREIIRSVQLGVTALMVTLLVACSASQPSADDGEQALLSQIKSESEGRMKLVSFQKTNGQKGEHEGVQVYRLEFEAVLEFTEDCKWGMERNSFKTVKAVEQTGYMNPGVLVKKGQRAKLSGSIEFEKTEKGWRAAGMKIQEKE